MLIKVEPAEIFMYRVQFVFDLEQPDAEDSLIRKYMTERSLEPRHRATGELDGHRCKFMQFGGCYLGRHLDAIARIQRQAVEEELLAEEIARHLAQETTFSDQERQQIIPALVAQFHQESAFQTSEQGELAAVLDGNAVRQTARRLVNYD